MTKIYIFCQQNFYLITGLFGLFVYYNLNGSEFTLGWSACLIWESVNRRIKSESFLSELEKQLKI